MIIKAEKGREFYPTSLVHHRREVKGPTSQNVTCFVETPQSPCKLGWLVTLGGMTVPSEKVRAFIKTVSPWSRVLNPGVMQG